MNLMTKAIYVKKLDGTFEQYDSRKLVGSLVRSGAGKKEAREIVREVEKGLKEGMSTTVIYKKAFQLLNKMESAAPGVPFRYSLRRAISEFGPSGFPFEKFVAEVFRLRGYKTQVGKMIKGRCVSHEMDVIASNDKELLTAELKFHNQLSIKTDLKVALYIKARFEDIEQAGYYGDKKARQAIITNTKFSSNAIRYSTCVGVELIGWNYPKEGMGNLHDLIIESGIHPITCLTTLTKKQKQYFLEMGVITCSELAKHNGALLKEARAHIPKEKLAKILLEIKTICECVGPECAKD